MYRSHTAYQRGSWGDQLGAEEAVPPHTLRSHSNKKEQGAVEDAVVRLLRHARLVAVLRAPSGRSSIRGNTKSVPPLGASDNVQVYYGMVLVYDMVLVYQG